METPVTENIYFILIAGTLGMLVLVGVVITFVLFHRRRMMKHELHLRNTQLQHQQELVYKNLQTQEAERMRIARDLHDEVGSMLSILRLYLAAPPQAEPGEVVQQNSAGKQMIDRIINRVRHISHELLPPGLGLFGLPKTLQDLCDDYRQVPGISVVFKAGNENMHCHYETALALYRIVQELLNNTLKHSGANLVHIHVTATQTEMVLTYADNGKGFNPALLASGKGLGLGNMQNRVNMLHGKLDLITAPGQGMKMNITVPANTKTLNVLNHANTH